MILAVVVLHLPSPLLFVSLLLSGKKKKKTSVAIVSLYVIYFSAVVSCSFPCAFIVVSPLGSLSGILSIAWPVIHLAPHQSPGTARNWCGNRAWGVGHGRDDRQSRGR
jgi:hypothetical protein